MLLKLKTILLESLFRNALFLMLANMSPSIVGYFFWILIAQFYDPSVVGKTAAVVMSLSLLVSVSDLGLGIGLIYYLPKVTSKIKLIRTCLFFGTVCSVIFTCIYLILIPYVNESLIFLFDSPFYLLLFVMAGVSSVINYLLGSVFMSNLKSQFVFYQQLLISILRLLIVFPLSVVFYDDMEVVFSLAIATIIVLIIGQLYFIPTLYRGKFLFPSIHNKLSEIKDVLTYSFSNYLGRFMLEGQQSLVPILVMANFGAVSNGYFYIAWIPALLIRVIPNSMFNSLLSEASQKNADFNQVVVKAVKQALIILVPAVLAIYFLADWVLMFFGADYVQESKEILQVLVFSNFAWMINYLGITITRIKKMPIYTTFLAFVLFVSVIFGVFLAVDSENVVDVAYGYLYAQCFVAFLTVVVMGYKFYVSKNYKESH